MNQDDRIIEYLKAGYSLTGLEALNLFGTMKLATRISEIKRKNPDFDIRDEYVHANGKSFKKYWIHKVAHHGDMFMSPDAVKQHEWSRRG
jgi:hypothetical protein